MPLPATCGEESGLPGVPGVGCVACVTLPATEQHARFDCCLTSSCSAIYLIGPRQLNNQTASSTSAVVTRRLWVVPGQDTSHTESYSTANTTNNDNTNSTDEGDGGVRYIDALTAFPLLHTQVDTEGTQTDNVTRNTDVENVHMADLTVIVVAWTDAQTQASHVSFLLCDVVKMLTIEGSDDTLSNECAVVAPLWYLQDAVPLPRSLHVMRLFSHERFSASRTSCAHVVLCACVVMNEEPITTTTSTAMLQSTSRVNAGSNAMASATASLSAGPRLGTSAPREPGRMSSTPTATSNAVTMNSHHNSASTHTGRRHGQLLRISLHSTAATPTLEHELNAWHKGGSVDASSPVHLLPWPTSLLPVQHATQAEVPSWLWRFEPVSVVSAFDVQDTCDTYHYSSESKDVKECENVHTSIVAAAAGTIGGHVYLLYNTPHNEENSKVSEEVECGRLVRRLAGPISDLRFVHTTQPQRVLLGETKEVVREENESRHASVNKLLESASHVTHAVRDTLALVVLDSIGQVAVLRNMNSEFLHTQSVPDVAHFFALRGDSRVMPNTDLHALRTLFAQHTVRETQHQQHEGDTAVHANTPHSVNTNGAVRPELSHRAGCELRQQAGLTGHLLSRGVVCLSSYIYNNEDDNGSAELIVSTMGQVLVGLRYDTREDGFVISAFIDTPYPIFEVCPLHIQNYSTTASVMKSPTLLVLAGMKGVLLSPVTASTSNNSKESGDDAASEEAVLCERAALLRRLLRPHNDMLET